jgi:hypothetical protein
VVDGLVGVLYVAPSTSFEYCQKVPGGGQMVTTSQASNTGELQVSVISLNHELRQSAIANGPPTSVSDAPTGTSFDRRGASTYTMRADSLLNSGTSNSVLNENEHEIAAAVVNGLSIIISGPVACHLTRQHAPSRRVITLV